MDQFDCTNHQPLPTTTDHNLWPVSVVSGLGMWLELALGLGLGLALGLLSTVGLPLILMIRKCKLLVIRLPPMQSVMVASGQC